ncbi:MAG: ABC transporter substrate-binding protein [Flavobacteriaceae bacterium]|nr:ABC transporter substrate-binding protein [Flavobacteriaceae bacterium]
MLSNSQFKLRSKLKTGVFTLCIILLISCKNNLKKDVITEGNINFKSSIKYAKGFDIQVFDTYTKLIIKSPYPGAKIKQEFILLKSNDQIKTKNQNHITIPLKKIIATSTTHIPMLELIGAENSLIGFPNTDYITSPKTSVLIKNGKIQDIGNEQSVNTEILLTLQPDAVIAFSMGNTTKMYNTINKNGIPVIYNSDWLEETPLGRAEWIKFFGALYDKNNLADSIFEEIETKYLKAKQIAKKSKYIPTILTGVLYKDKWNLPAGESFTAQLYKDANTNYLWKNSKGQGSLVLSFEAVLEKAQNADFWIGSGYYTNRKELADTNAHYTEFKAYKNKQIYTFSKKKGINGGVIYFELAAIQPHIVLQDLIKVTHPDLLPNYKPYFLEKLDEN